ncbi:MAG: ATP-binding protein [Chloroflexi bacterium]|nr:MAG: ATP-binding protein [Chloroflexota bacterium]
MRRDRDAGDERRAACHLVLCDRSRRQPRRAAGLVPVTTPAEGKRSISVPATVDELAKVRAFVRDSVSRFGGSKRVADDLAHAVDEATCNVMLHGYRGKAGDVEIEAAVRDRRIEIRILDRGPIFDPTTAQVPAPGAIPAPTRPGGMGVGIQLLRTLTDEVHHSARPDGGNELTLVRSIDGRREED